MNRFLRGIGIYLIIAIVAVSIVSNLYPSQERRQEVSFSEFMQWVPWTACSPWSSSASSWWKAA